ncbi:phosphorylase [Sphingomonas sp. DC1600-2]|uniref:phosphorylase family protein n=1 Tax=unclassified Sphingomonas TaxID=196159 RepID=UPI003CF809BA
MTILVACGLTREAAIIARPGLVVVAGGGDAARLERELEAAVGGVSAVLSCGVAGALDPALRAGDVVLGDLHISHHPGEGRGPVAASERIERCPSPQPPSRLGPGLRRGGGLVEWLAAALPNAHLGTVVGADRIIASATEKAALHAHTGAIAVDMESHIAARVAARHNLPFAILRTISDSADHALPPAALVGMKPDGGVALGAILASLARNPAQLPALIRTGREAGAAFSALRRALGALEALGIGGLDLREFTLDV